MIEELMSIINKVQIEDELKEIWRQALKHLSLEEYLMLTECLNSLSEEEIKEVSLILKQKIEFFKTKNKSLLHEILFREKEFL
jgi:hypothetical protein